MSEQKCRICGCTEGNCSQCIKLTGYPCHWVEEDLCSACADAINKKPGVMNFFQQLAAVGTGNTDLTMRIMEKNGKLTINIMPGAGSSAMQPILVTGTPAELDEEFFTAIAPQVQEIAGLVTNINEVKKAVEEQKDSAAKTPVVKKPNAATKSAKENKAEPKAEKKSAVKKAPAVVPKKKSKQPPTLELTIFDMGGAESAPDADPEENETDK